MADSAEPLAATFQRLIANFGPVTLQHFMGESNARYYAGKDPLGSAGDFITAPEVSQMFGELTGLWLADIWMRAGGGKHVHYVELGPGRGTLARDALRAMQRAGLEPHVHLVEGSTALREIQRAAVPQAEWHHDVASLPEDGPLLVMANEFLDALPVRQLVKTPQGWRERMVDWQDGHFLPVAGDKLMDAAVPADMREQADGTLIETCPGAVAVVHDIAGRLAAQGGAALFIDYGYDASRTGSTLQALKEHTKVDPFAMPGEADLTCLVDFAAMADAARSGGARHLGTVTQGAFLRDLGIGARAAKLAAAAPEHADSLRSALERLTGEEQMGTLFKVMGLAAPDWPQGAAF
ncbi:class I SAM-dependent methyltransferase [Novosphingobium beihaiensis]|uniref:SAM-dependent methyltransferase n=1 Tax=Novosphingobium beihaiensis TaxID=2930389 RepID=A0ABT0BPN4_9SPHN|nr:SAM-dependent methyltransferase [Novosphingobium beihaiensis]MCJ2187012.1 SAM-dependent methyltransferase [Novosphingobium beihaiensis]